MFGKAADFDFTFSFGDVSFAVVVAEFAAKTAPLVGVLGFLPLHAGFAVGAAATNLPNRHVMDLFKS